ncbi:MAG: molecular chaperone DnaK, partial [Actinomycetes bacterium]
AERVLKDLGDKVASEDKLEVENQVASLREALKGSDMDIVKTGMTALAETLNKVGAAAYQASAAEAAAGGDGAPGEGAEGGEGSAPEGAAGEGAAEGATADDETVEGEFKEV